MKIIVQADDYGLTKGITDNILDSYDNGVLTNTSIFANGDAFDYAINEYKKRPGLGLAVHLNLVEGKSIASPESVDLIVDNNGELCRSFLALWWEYAFGKKERREELKNQVKHEMSAQINRVKQSIGGDYEIRIDSHLHYHMIPFVFSALLELSCDYDISYVRIPDEPFLLNSGAALFKNSYKKNIIKHFLLKSLCARYKMLLSEAGIKYCDHFIGVLYSGEMSEGIVKMALSKIKMKKCDEGLVEVLLHPGRAEAGEEKRWEGNEELKRYYYSAWRKKELDVIKSRSFKDIILGQQRQ